MKWFNSNVVKLLLYIGTKHGVRHGGGGAGGPWLPKESTGDAVMHLAPQILGKILLCTN